MKRNFPDTSHIDPYEEHECCHSHNSERRGVRACHECGFVCNESTLEWEPNDE